MSRTSNRTSTEPVSSTAGPVRPRLRWTGPVLAIVSLVTLAAARTSAAESPRDLHPVVHDLVALLDARPDLRSGLEEALRRAALEELPTTDDFLAFCDHLLTRVPIERELVPPVLRYHFVIGQAPEDRLNEDPAFAAWMGDFARAMGRFLDTPESVAHIETFTSDPRYRVGDYDEGPSGWRTFNQFFARTIRPGKRPIAAPCDDRVIVSPADAVFMGQWPISEASTISVKGVEWSIAELLAGSPYADSFANGTYSHVFLSTTDYHRYHLPLGGVVREIRNVRGRVYLDVARSEEGGIVTHRGDTFQFEQERGLVVVDSPDAGLVAILPVGMSVISSVNLTPEVGAELRKGDELGYFLFGGSDIVLLFEEDVVLDAEVGTRYLQGQRIGAATAGGG